MTTVHCPSAPVREIVLTVLGLNSKSDLHLTLMRFITTSHIQAVTQILLSCHTHLMSEDLPATGVSPWVHDLSIRHPIFSLHHSNHSLSKALGQLLCTAPSDPLSKSDLWEESVRGCGCICGRSVSWLPCMHVRASGCGMWEGLLRPQHSS